MVIYKDLSTFYKGSIQFMMIYKDLLDLHI